MGKKEGISRRTFVQSLLGSAAFAAVANHIEPLRAFAQSVNPDSAMPTRPLGNTGYRVWQTPFGYFCEWDLAVYGDSLAKVFKEL